MSITPVLVSDGVVYPHDTVDLGAPVVEWFGAYPYLDTADGSTSYGQPGDLPTYVIGARLDPFTPSGTLTGTFQVKPLFVGVNEFSFRLYDGGTFLVQSDQVSVVQPGDTWLDGTVSFTVTPEIVDAAQRGDLIFARSAYNPGPISCLFLEGGATPLRLMQRGDTLGMGSGRVLGVGTRQAGIKVLGSY